MELLQISKDEQTCQKELQMAKKQAFNLKCQNKYLRIFSPICVALKKGNFYCWWGFIGLSCTCVGIIHG